MPTQVFPCDSRSDTIISCGCNPNSTQGPYRKTQVVVNAVARVSWRTCSIRAGPVSQCARLPAGSYGDSSSRSHRPDIAGGNRVRARTPSVRGGNSGTVGVSERAGRAEEHQATGMPAGDRNRGLRFATPPLRGRCRLFFLPARGSGTRSGRTESRLSSRRGSAAGAVRRPVRLTARTTPDRSWSAMRSGPAIRGYRPGGSRQPCRPVAGRAGARAGALQSRSG